MIQKQVIFPSLLKIKTNKALPHLTTHVTKFKGIKNTTSTSLSVHACCMHYLRRDRHGRCMFVAIFCLGVCFSIESRDFDVFFRKRLLWISLKLEISSLKVTQIDWAQKCKFKNWKINLKKKEEKLSGRWKIK